jgi:hypothetical protein
MTVILKVKLAAGCIQQSDLHDTAVEGQGTSAVKEMPSRLPFSCKADPSVQLQHELLVSF